MSSTSDRPRSLERQLGLTLGLLLALVLSILLGLSAWLARETALQFALSRLEHDAEAMLGAIDLEQHRLDQPMPPIYRQPLSGHYYTLRFPDGQELKSRSQWNLRLLIPHPEHPHGSWWLEDGPQAQQLLVWQGRFRKNGQELLLVVAEDVAPLLTAIRGYLWAGVLAALSAVLLVLALQRAILRRAFARLDRTRREIRQVREGRLQRLGTEVPAEVRPLVEEFNHLLEAWREHQARSRNAVGNLAHALKTPLQLILRQAETSGDSQLQAAASRMQHRLEQELRRARIIGPAGAGQHFRPHDDGRDLVDTIQTLYRDRALQIDVDIRTPDTLPFEQTDLIELLGNLLDNAAKWARHRIRLTLELDQGCLHITIDDDGPGIPPQERDQILARGHRLDENRPGHGLGLAIASEITACYHGQLQLEQAPELGGLRVSIELPLP